MASPSKPASSTWPGSPAFLYLPAFLSAEAMDGSSRSDDVKMKSISGVGLQRVGEAGQRLLLVPFGGNARHHVDRGGVGLERQRRNRRAARWR